MKNVLISGYYGFNNTGDEAMIETMSSLLAKRDYGLIVLSSNPEKTKELYNVQAYNRYKLGEVRKAMKKADLVVSGGGTLFQDITSKKSLYYYLGIVRFAQLMKKKICVAYQGIGPLLSNFNRRLTKHVLNKNSVKLIALRDDQAISFAKDIGIDGKKIIFSSDMIFMLQPPAKERCEKILRDNVHGYKEGQKLIGISIREWKDKDRTDLFAQMADRIVEEYDARVVFFPFHKPKDAEISKIVMHKMKHEDSAVLMPNRYLPSEILGVMGMMDINIGVRLHALVFSAVMNVPTIGISYDPKIDGFLDTIGMKSICNYDNIDTEKILREVCRLIDEEKIDYTKNIEYFKKTGTETLDKILEELEK